MTHRFTATIIQNGNMDAAYVRVPIDIKKEYGTGRLKVEATFDVEPYSGSVVNMGVKNADGSVCYIIGIPQAIRKKIDKTFGDSVEVTLNPVL
ncbi:MAG: DUF1905 domain-containing protein [Bacteroidales bacterium]|nr:DUF1905 domain-containing protein [Bacteroidales bacterium]